MCCGNSRRRSKWDQPAGGEEQHVENNSSDESAPATAGAAQFSAANPLLNSDVVAAAVSNANAVANVVAANPAAVSVVALAAAARLNAILASQGKTVAPAAGGIVPNVRPTVRIFHVLNFLCSTVVVR